MDIEFCQKYGPWGVLTGASSGIGAIFAVELAKRGLALILIGRNLERLQQVAQQCQSFGVETLIVTLDITHPSSLEVLKEKIGTREVGFFIHNAGLGSYGPFIEQPLQDQLDMVQVHCVATLQFAHFFLARFLAQRRGALLIMASAAGLQPIPSMLVYSASKAFELHFGEGLYEELRGTGVDVLTIAPGFVETPFFSHARVTLNRLFPYLSPEAVVYKALNNLGKKPLIILGLTDLLLSWGKRIVPRKWTARLAGSYIRHALKKNRG